MLCVVAASRKGYEKIADELSELTGQAFVCIGSREELTFERLKELNPRYVFFPHWSYIIPAEIYENFECVIFHMTDVPFGRGGSPLQNLVSRGIYETKMTAMKCVAELDAGPVFLKRDLSLHGNAEEIYLRSAEIIAGMIRDVIKEQPVPQAQQGEVVSFRRRRPEESDVKHLESLGQLYDYIRMLDADDYPKAYLETDKLHLEFTRASKKDGYLLADVKITEKVK